MTSEKLAEYCRALAAVYDDAIRELRVTELKPFLVHEVTWLNNAPRVGAPEEALELHLKQAREYLSGILSLHNRRPHPPSLRLFVFIALTWLLSRSHELADWIGRLT